MTNAPPEISVRSVWRFIGSELSRFDATDNFDARNTATGEQECTCVMKSTLPPKMNDTTSRAGRPRSLWTVGWAISKPFT